MKIPVYLVTGFLGSGKTTFLDQILKSFDKKYRIGVVQNEFAPANVDGKELRVDGRSFEILEINNGSIFCICLLDNFTHSLASFVKEKKPDLILMETSGLSDPASVVEVMQNPLLSELVFLSKVWCIVDGCHFFKIEKMVSRIRHQLIIADTILINKADLTKKNDLSRIKDHIGKINPAAQLFQTNYCRIDLSFMENEPERYPLAYRHEGIIQPADQFRAEMGVGVFKSGRKISYGDLQDLVRSITHSTIRIKGNVLLTDGQTALVQTVFNDININFAQDRYGTTCLVLMGENFNLSSFSKRFRALTTKNEH